MRQHVTVVFQDFVRYALSLADNIELGRPASAGDNEALGRALEQAGLVELAERLPDGTATPLGPEFLGGVDLSGGQWQRVALARAFFRDAPFVILDEPTAALDPRSEAALFDGVRALFAGRAVLLISHRFSSVRNANRIYVLHEGRVIEHGTHARSSGCHRDQFLASPADPPESSWLVTTTATITSTAATHTPASEPRMNPKRLRNSDGPLECAACAGSAPGAAAPAAAR